MHKQYAQQKQNADRSVTVVQRLVIDLGFIWRSIEHNDVGLDGTIELCAPGSGAVLGKLIGVQVKSSRRRFPGESDTTFYWPCRARDVAYWLDTNIPVILIVVRTGIGGDEAYWIDVKRYFAGTDVPHKPRIFFHKEHDRFDERTAPALHQAIVIAPRLAPPRNMARLRARDHGSAGVRRDLRWPGYLRAVWWLYRRAGKLLLYRQALEVRRGIGLLEGLRCLDEVDRERIREPVARHERFLAGFAFGEGVRTWSVHLAAAWVSGIVAFHAAPRLTSLLSGAPAPTTGQLRAGLGIIGAVLFSVGIPVLWHRLRRVPLPRWLNVARVAAGSAVLAAVLAVTGVQSTAGTLAGRVASAALWTVLLTGFGYVNLRPYVDLMARSQRSQAERERPEAGIVHRLLQILGMIDHDERPWADTATRRRLLRLLSETARLFERDAAGRLGLDDPSGNRAWRRRCREMAAHVRGLASRVAMPGGTAQEELQQEVIEILIPVATGEWSDVPTAPVPPARWSRGWRLTRRSGSEAGADLAGGERRAPLSV